MAGVLKFGKPLALAGLTSVYYIIYHNDSIFDALLNCCVDCGMYMDLEALQSS